VGCSGVDDDVGCSGVDDDVGCSGIVDDVGCCVVLVNGGCGIVNDVEYSIGGRRRHHRYRRRAVGNRHLACAVRWISGGRKEGKRS
jgi:hypothetical protein